VAGEPSRLRRRAGRETIPSSYFFLPFSSTPSPLSDSPLKIFNWPTQFSRSKIKEKLPFECKRGRFWIVFIIVISRAGILSDGGIAVLLCVDRTVNDGFVVNVCVSLGRWCISCVDFLLGESGCKKKWSVLFRVFVGNRFCVCVFAGSCRKNPLFCRQISPFFHVCCVLFYRSGLRHEVCQNRDKTALVWD